MRRGEGIEDLLAGQAQRTAAGHAQVSHLEVHVVVDAVGGTSKEAHRAGLQRITQAGGVPISWIQLACELQRDWNRERTAPGFAGIVFAEVGH